MEERERNREGEEEGGKDLLFTVTCFLTLTSYAVFLNDIFSHIQACLQTTNNIIC
jgi:hypothetical protein